MNLQCVKQSIDSAVEGLTRDLGAELINSPSEGHTESLTAFFASAEEALLQHKQSCQHAADTQNRVQLMQRDLLEICESHCEELANFQQKLLRMRLFQGSKQLTDAQDDPASQHRDEDLSASSEDDELDGHHVQGRDRRSPTVVFSRWASRSSEPPARVASSPRNSAVGSAGGSSGGSARNVVEILRQVSGNEHRGEDEREVIEVKKRARPGRRYVRPEAMCFGKVADELSFSRASASNELLPRHTPRSPVVQDEYSRANPDPLAAPKSRTDAGVYGRASAGHEPPAGVAPRSRTDTGVYGRASAGHHPPAGVTPRSRTDAGEYGEASASDDLFPSVAPVSRSYDYSMPASSVGKDVRADLLRSSYHDDLADIKLSVEHN
eukprot:TRINITY_DN22815_c0_g1_i1.p1 TRINITY_DN22815_c0_g1~~TRINITY_DN22815_c0_g1_i1.p1  ORF type:complete len:423 (-),score=41.51 TRINITY_DN22815_c0_g1_i1:282-1421(-)